MEGQTFNSATDRVTSNRGTISLGFVQNKTPLRRNGPIAGLIPKLGVFETLFAFGVVPKGGLVETLTR